MMNFASIPIFSPDLSEAITSGERQRAFLPGSTFPRQIPRR
jgi:hypothetical protein